MKRPYRRLLVLGKANFALPLLLSCGLLGTRAGEWQATPDRLSRNEGPQTLWSFAASTNFGKAHFHPLATAGGVVLTGESPADHPWHYGLWFSWKYINKVNFWEQDKKTGRAEGRTRWEAPVLQPHDDGSAEIRMALSYDAPSGGVWLTESRQIRVAAPAADGSYTIDWDATFTVGATALEFGRTPMPGEPGGQVNGGYGGFSLRMPVDSNVYTWSSTAAEPRFESGRWRPRGPAIQSTMVQGTKTGAVVLISHPDNTPGEAANWYVVDNKPMRFCCAAILAPAPLKKNPGDVFKLRYRVIVRSSPLEADALRAAAAHFAE